LGRAYLILITYVIIMERMGQSYSPRKLELAELVKVLVAEHNIMRGGLARARDSLRRKDYPEVSRVVKSLDPVFRQHIADEESQILGLLIARLGVRGAEEEIAVFRQHRPIYQLLQKLEDIARTPASELAAREVELQRLFSEHTKLEETRVFPKAESLGH
jgi:hemerythrin-like domain-containing protein